MKSQIFLENIDYIRTCMKGRIVMPNYRTNTMPCNNRRYPAAPMPMPMPRCDVWNDKSLAMAYVPWQTWRDIYEADKGFHCGTIFQELNLPFLGKGGMRR